MEHKLFDTVVLARDLPERGLRAGDLGAIVEVYQPDGLEVEFVSDPQVMHGEPVFRGTRVQVRTLLDYVEAGDPLERFLDHFRSVRREQAVAVLEEAGRHGGRADVR